MKVFRVIVLISSIWLFSMCDDDSQGMEENVYEGCCETEALFVDLDSGFLQAPNMISPNADGVNDSFRIFVSSEEHFVSELKVFDRTGAEVFSETNDDGESPITGYNPAENSDGLHTYNLKLSTNNGTLQEYSGSFCSSKCFLDLVETMGNLSDCIFEQQILQATGTGYNPEQFTNWELGTCN